MDTTRKVTSAIIGLGRMGELFLKEMSSSGQWSVKYACDIDKDRLELANTISPGITTTSDDQEIFNDPEVEVVVLTALADTRFEQIKECIKSGKHIITEKPLSDSVEKEWEIVRMLEESHLLATINLPLRNAWYNKEIKEFIRSGELGELAIIRICHMTPGLSPGEGHGPEGPCFHDCGMHYVDLARWIAESEYKSWNAQAVDFWSYGEPWWLQCHGTFENGVVFDITQGHMYGQLAKDLTHISYNDIIGTKGVARMSHDFKNARLELHGTTKTIHLSKPYGDKNIDILCSLFAQSVICGTLDPALPRLKDAATASETAWKFLANAKENELPSIGSREELDAIHDRRINQGIGYGLLRKK